MNRIVPAFIDCGVFMQSPEGACSRRFRYGTCCGLYFREGAVFVLLAVLNEVPHNGEFKRFMDLLEREEQCVRVLHLLNERLHRWLKRRGYRGDAQCMERAQRRGREREHQELLAHAD